MVPSMGNVLRGGRWAFVDPSMLVRGDVVKVKAGDKIPADIRILSVNAAKVSS